METVVMDNRSSACSTGKFDYSKVQKTQERKIRQISMGKQTLRQRRNNNNLKIEYKFFYRKGKTNIQME